MSYYLLLTEPMVNPPREEQVLIAVDHISSVRHTNHTDNGAKVVVRCIDGASFFVIEDMAEVRRLLALAGAKTLRKGIT